MSSPFSVGMERELDMFVLSRPEDGYNRGGDTAVVREAQRRARRRALSERKRTAAARERKMEDLEVSMSMAHDRETVFVTQSIRSAEECQDPYRSLL